MNVLEKNISKQTHLLGNRYPWTPLSIFISIFIAITFSYYNLMGYDNTYQFYHDMMGTSEVWRHNRDFRFIVGFILSIVHDNGIKYYDLIWIWVVLFAASFAICGLAFFRYIDIPPFIAVIATGLVALHGYFTDIYSFSMGYVNYGIGLLGAALALWSGRLSQPFGAIALGSLGVLISLSSYQPFALTPLFGAALLPASFALQEKNFGGLAKIIFNTLVGFIIGFTIYFIIVSFIYKGSVRDASVYNIYGNILEYIYYIPNLFFGWRFYETPKHEHLYLLSIIFLFLILLTKRSFYIVTISWLGLLIGILLGPDPFILLSDTFYPTARASASFAFFAVGALVLLYVFTQGKRSILWFYFIIMFASASLYNHVNYLMLQSSQEGRDSLAIDLIIHEISKNTNITKDTKLAVKSTWKAFVRAPYGISSFSTSWSSASIFRVRTGKFTPVPVPSGACLTEPSEPWVLEEVGDVFVVCMK